jgi:serine/threonine protein kinase
VQVAIKAVNMKKGQNEAGNKRAWEMEAKALEKIRNIDHDHIIKCLAAIRRGQFRFFMFPWADGNLREFWDNYRGPYRKPKMVEQVVNQLYGLADALDKMHNYDASANQQGLGAGASKSTLSVDPHIRGLSRKNTSTSENIRHGDLKPENLLRFSGSHDDLGTIKIGDMGMAKHHVVDTQARPGHSTTSYGTWRYQAPEAITKDPDQPRTRREDIWAMGCIVLEFIIWILYGNRVLTTFNDQIIWDLQQLSPFFKLENDGGATGAVLHKVVLEWIDDILPQDPECQRESAIRDLLDIVKNKLLVINYLPKEVKRRPAGPRLVVPNVVVTDNDAPREVTATSFDEAQGSNIRATAQEFRDAIQKIRDKINVDRRYLLDPRQEPVQPLVQSSGTLLLPANRFATKDYTMPPVRTWEFPIDNDFAGTVFSRPQSLRLLPSSPSSGLCSQCGFLDFCKPESAFEKSAQNLERDCGMCGMLFNMYRQLELTSSSTLSLSRKEEESCLRAHGFDLPVLALLRSPSKFCK